MTGRLIDLSIGLNRKQRVTLEVDQDFRETFDSLNGAELDIEIKKHREKRSLNANSYMWVLLDKLAETLQEHTKEDLYRLCIKRVGVFRDWTLTEEEVRTFTVLWTNQGTGWVTERVDYDETGEKIILRAYYGSSTYNTKQMSRLIDMVIEACKEQGIETATPEEIALMKARWEDAKQTYKGADDFQGGQG